MLFESPVQLDIFNDNRVEMLRNDVLQWLQAHDAARAAAAIDTLARDYPQDPLLDDARVLQRALQARTQPFASIPFSQHAELHRDRLALLNVLAPAAHRRLERLYAQTWLRPFWHDLVARANTLVFRADAEQDHAAWMLLQLQDWQACANAVAHIESWRRIPAPLSWMTQAKLQTNGLRAAWPLLAELAWLTPQRLPALVAAACAPQLRHLLTQFESAWDDLEHCESPQLAPVNAAHSPQNERAFAWFPAWVLTAAPQHAPDLALAQPGQHTAPEQAMRLLVNLLGLEHQGRHHELVKLRQDLRNLHAGLYAAYMSTR